MADSQNASVRKTIKIHVKAEEKPEDPNTPDKDDIPDKGDMPDKGNTPDQNGADKENADANKKRTNRRQNKRPSLGDAAWRFKRWTFCAVCIVKKR